MHRDQSFSLFMLVLGILAVTLLVGSVRSYWHKLRVGSHRASGDVSQSWVPQQPWHVRSRVRHLSPRHLV
jgi:hypothetical protein